MNEPPVASPCTKVCTMDPSSGLCIGCRRTLEEIANWGSMRDEERAAVLAKLGQRRAQASELQDR